LDGACSATCIVPCSKTWVATRTIRRNDSAAAWRFDGKGHRLAGGVLSFSQEAIEQRLDAHVEAQRSGP
jgi:hypothetical protein